MNSNVLFTIWYIAIILAICLFSITFSYKKYSKTRRTWAEKIEHAQIELTEDLSSLKRKELSRTLAGRELLSLIAETQEKYPQTKLSISTYLRLAFSFFTIPIKKLYEFVLSLNIPDTYTDIPDELIVSRKYSRQIHLEKELRPEDIDKKLKSISSANQIYEETKKQDIEEKIKLLENQLREGKINLDKFDAKTQELYRVIKATYQEAMQPSYMKMPTEDERSENSNESD